ncbi:MAG: MBL fold metallo-hydrolase [Nitrospira sp.]|nr:MBL fold metallo-hydrolase [Nitrospira sp.]MCC7470622.1 MBL fold metallo-hydrolase [Candidatus Nomurabacteria bacterium]
MGLWDALPRDQYVGLAPWVWVQLESNQSPGPFPFVGGVAPEVVGSLHEAHSLFLACIETAISDIFSRRAVLDDPQTRVRLEDAYAELVNSRQQLSQHITARRQPDGQFHWSHPFDPTKSATVVNTGLRIFNAVKRQAIPVPFERPMGPLVGKLLGMLDGTQQAGAIRTIVTTVGRDGERLLTKLMELFVQYECLTPTTQASVRDQWLRQINDRDTVHLGHAALMYRQRDQFLLFDPWLLPWFAESNVPSLWVSLLPKPAAIFLTHDHDDHVDPRTLLHVPKDVPIVIPSRRNRKKFFYDYLPLLRELGFSHIIELAHGESWSFDGGAVVSVPFYGEDPCDLEMPRNCYLVTDRGQNVLVHADSGPTNNGRSAIQEGVIQRLVQKYGPLSLLLASQQQLQEIRSYAAHAPLSHPGQWLEVGENGYLTNRYLDELCATAQARLFVSYATGGADWYPDHLSFMFSQRNPARTALLTAHWEPPEKLKDLLAQHDCRYHRAHALDVFRNVGDESMEVRSAAESLSPLPLYRVDHGDPSFMKRGGR